MEKRKNMIECKIFEKEMILDKQTIKKMSGLSAGAIFLLFKCINNYYQTQSVITSKTLQQLSKMSKNTFYIYYNELIVNKWITSDNSEEFHPALRIKREPIDYVSGIKMKIGSTEEEPSIQSITMHKAVKDIGTLIVDPYKKELKKRGLADSITKSSSGYMIAKLRKVLNQFKGKLNHKDILNILMKVLDTEFFIKNNQYLNIDFIFFNKNFLVMEYLKNKPHTTEGYSIPKDAFYVQNIKDKILDPEQYGYFKWDGDCYLHVVPTNPNSMYKRISDEMLNRMNNTCDSKYDCYFDGNILKKEYTYLSGSVGANNKFVHV